MNGATAQPEGSGEEPRGEHHSSLPAEQLPIDTLPNISDLSDLSDSDESEA